MEQDILISVIVPVYNAESYLAKCVQSILDQTYTNLEVILVNDGSSDGSGAICDEYAAKDSRVRVIHKENGGQSSARNMALDIFSGQYVTFVDSDDWIETDAYEHMLNLMLQHDVKLVSAGRYDVDSLTGEKVLGLCPRKTEMISAEETMGRLFIWDGCDSSPCDKLYHRSLFNNVRFPEKSVSEDIAVVYRLIEAAGKVVMYDKPIYNYFHRPNSSSSSSLSEKTFHFEEHTAGIYPYIQQNYPAIQNQARYFRVRSLVYAVLSCELVSTEQRSKFIKQYRECKAMLRRHIGFILTSKYISTKDRIVYLSLAYGLYPVLRKIYHTVK